MTTGVGAGDTLQSNRPSCGTIEGDTLNQKGAMALAQRLEQFWREEGYPAARFWAVPVEERFPKVGTYEIYRVDSNLVNGLPPRYLSQ